MSLEPTNSFGSGFSQPLAQYSNPQLQPNEGDAVADAANSSRKSAKREKPPRIPAPAPTPKQTKLYRELANQLKEQSNALRVRGGRDFWYMHANEVRKQATADVEGLPANLTRVPQSTTHDVVSDSEHIDEEEDEGMKKRKRLSNPGNVKKDQVKATSERTQLTAAGSLQGSSLPSPRGPIPHSLASFPGHLRTLSPPNKDTITHPTFDSVADRQRAALLPQGLSQHGPSPYEHHREIEHCSQFGAPLAERRVISLPEASLASAPQRIAQGVMPYFQHMRNFDQGTGNQDSIQRWEDSERAAGLHYERQSRNPLATPAQWEPGSDSRSTEDLRVQQLIELRSQLAIASAHNTLAEQTVAQLTQTCDFYSTLWNRELSLRLAEEGRHLQQIDNLAALVTEQIVPVSVSGIIDFNLNCLLEEAMLEKILIERAKEIGLTEDLLMLAQNGNIEETLIIIHRMLSSHVLQLLSRENDNLIYKRIRCLIDILLMALVIADPAELSQESLQTIHDSLMKNRIVQDIIPTITSISCMKGLLTVVETDMLTTPPIAVGGRKTWKQFIDKSFFDLCLMLSSNENIEEGKRKILQQFALWLNTASVAGVAV